MVAQHGGWWLDLAVLTVACLIAFFYGLTDHGLTNWQESQRAQVVREMHAAGEWLVPTINGLPYLAKPPWYYWVQLVTADIRGAAPSEWDLRFGVALAGLIGVLATYVVTRRHVERHAVRARGELGVGKVVSGREAGLWAGLFLATGPLYVRSARIGELDIWLAPLVAIAIGGVLSAWHTWVTTRRTGWGALVVATLAAAAAALAKGPPGIAVVGAASYGAMVLAEALRERESKAGVPSGRGRALVAAALAAGVVARFVLPRIEDVKDAAGAVVMIGLAAWMGWIIGRVMVLDRLKAIAGVLAHTHPVLVLGLPLAVLWGWGRLVAARIGPDQARFWAEKETEDNLNILVPESPIRNLEAMSFGVGLASLCAAAALVWLIWRRPRWSGDRGVVSGWIVPVAWVVMGLVIFSMLGKGIGRYLTPLWPGVAMLGGMFAATMFTGDPPRHARRMRVAVGVVCAAGVFVSGWWYGAGRERYFPERSPRAVMGELIAGGADPARMASFEFRTAALDYYAGRRVEPVGDIQIRDVTAGGKPWTIEQLRDRVVEGGPIIVFMRADQRAAGDRDPRAVLDRLKEIGLRVEPIPTRSRFAIDSGKSEVIAARVSAP